MTIWPEVTDALSSHEELSFKAITEKPSQEQSSLFSEPLFDNKVGQDHGELPQPINEVPEMK